MMMSMSRTLHVACHQDRALLVLPSKSSAIHDARSPQYECVCLCVQAKNEAEVTVYSAEKSVDEYKSKVTPEIIAEIQAALAEVRAAKDSDNLEELKAKVRLLLTSFTSFTCRIFSTCRLPDSPTACVPTVPIQSGMHAPLVIALGRMRPGSAAQARDTEHACWPSQVEALSKAQQKIGEHMRSNSDAQSAQTEGEGEKKDEEKK